MGLSTTVFCTAQIIATSLMLAVFNEVKTSSFPGKVPKKGRKYLQKASGRLVKLPT